MYIRHQALLVAHVIVNVPGVACSVDSVFLSGGKAVVIHLSRWCFMINRTYEGKLKACEVRTL